VTERLMEGRHICSGATGTLERRLGILAARQVDSAAQRTGEGGSGWPAAFLNVLARDGLFRASALALCNKRVGSASGPVLAGTASFCLFSKPARAIQLVPFINPRRCYRCVDLRGCCRLIRRGRLLMRPRCWQSCLALPARPRRIPVDAESRYPGCGRPRRSD